MVRPEVDAGDVRGVGASAQVAPVAERLERVRQRIASVPDADPGLRIVAVTKGFGVTAVLAALQLGLPDIGENYAQELVAKAAELAQRRGGPTGVPLPDPVWHFLGRVQRNKVGRLAGLVACWEAVGRPEEGASIQRHAPGARVLVEVDTTGEAGRPGVPPRAVGELVRRLRDDGLSVEGLMTVAPRDLSAARSAFSTVRELADGLGLPERSMGMSDDLELAVAAGATSVRLGRALFGPRETAAPGPFTPHRQ